MKFRKNILALSVTTALLGLTACGVTPQDEGTGETAGKASGLAVDGYLAGATVFADTNGNNKLDAWEPRAMTDTEGYFSYNPNSGTNYCESTVRAEQLFCLATPIGYDEVTLRISGGYDLTTMEKFSGTISMRLNVSGSVITTPQTATPITALLSHLDEDQKTALFAAEGITSADSSKDFLDFSTDTEIVDEAERRTLLGLALKTHKVADMVAGQLNLLFDQDVLANPGDTSLTAKGLFGEQKGIAANASDLVYQAIAEQVASGVGVSAIMADTTMMETAVNSAWQKIDAIVDAYNDRLVANDEDAETVDDLSSEDRLLKPASIDTAAVTAIAADAIALAGLADNLFTGALTGTESEDVASRIKALDIVTALMRAGNDKDSAETSNAISLASDATYLQNLRSNKADVSGLKDKFLNGSGSLTATDADYSDRKSFTGLLTQADNDSSDAAGLTVTNTEGMVNNSLNVSDEGESTSISFLPPEGTDAADVDPDASSGVLKIEGAILDEIFSGDDSTGDSGSTDETSTEALEGTWEQLDEYTMLMNVEIAGVNQPIIIKPTLDESGTEAYYLDVGGEQKIWTP